MNASPRSHGFPFRAARLGLLLFVCPGVSALFTQPLPTGPATPAEFAAIADLQTWAATTAANGAAGRPLPVAGHWNTGPDFNRLLDRLSGTTIEPVAQWREGWSPSYMAGLVRQGKRVIITFPDTSNATVAYYQSVNDTTRLDAVFDYLYKPALDYARAHGLPIAFTGFNWEDQVAWNGPRDGDGTAWMLRGGTTITGYDDQGNPVYTREVDPLGPVSVWQDWGAAWVSNSLIQRIQTFYPNPPLVVFFNNNEGGHLIEASALGNTSDRYNALHPGDASLTTKAAAIRDGYTARYQAMQASARAAFTQTAWRDNSRFVAYNAWSNAVMGRGNFYPVADGGDIWFEPAADRGFRQPFAFDGAMPEFYDNQWQGSKTDFCPWSPQTEAFNLYAIQDRVFAEQPDYYFSNIAWEGGRADIPFNKVNGYILGDFGRDAQRWGPDRYQGMHQFGLWAMRPREYREFRATEPLDGYNRSTWESLLAATERIWGDETLRDYWRFGALVQNPTAAAALNGHYFDNNAAWPAWLKNTPRWFLLTSSANPAESTWDRDQNNAPSIKLRILALALRRGEAPDRRWLVYAHAPLGAVAGSQVTVPGFGSATLDYVAQSGSFFELREAGGTIVNLVRGGPAEIAVSASKRRVAVGETFTVSATVTLPLADTFTSFTWTTGEGDPVVRTTLASRSLSLNTPGEHFITVEAATAGGAKVTGQSVVFVGDAPDASVAYQLSLDRAYDWQGLWSANDTAAVNYRLVPNAAADATVEVAAAGGAFVQDAERGGVFKLSQPGDGLTLQSGNRTTYLADGHSGLTVSFWFKADALAGTQGLFAQGYASGDGGGGYSIYLSGDRLYAGSWSLTGRPAASETVPADQARWNGNWLSTASGRIEAGKWHQVRLVLRGATNLIAPDKLFLYIDESLVAQGPAVRAKRHWTPPRLGFLDDARIHTGVNTARAQFRGGLDDVRYLTAAPAPADLSRLKTALNAGGPAVLGVSGVPYSADTGFTGGAARTVSATAPITGGEDPDVYRSARQGASFSYALPVANGPYRVVLKFAELDHPSPNLRRFGVTAEDSSVASALDLFALRGFGGGYDIEFPVTVNDGTLDLVFTATTGEATVSAIQVWDTSTSAASHSLFAQDAPAITGNDNTAYELGLRFSTDTAGQVTALRYYRPAAETGAHTGRLWDSAGTLLATVPFTAETSSGWQETALATPVALTPGQLYTVSVNANASYAYTAGGMTADRASGPLTAPGDGANGVYGTTLGARPVTVFTEGKPNYFRDVVFRTGSVPTAREQWRQTHFGVSTATGDAADLADPDGDGLNNLLEYALGGDPTSPADATRPAVQLATSALQLTFLRARADLIYVVQGSSDLLVWEDLATNPGAVSATVPVVFTDSLPLSDPTSRRFLRLKVNP